jgi:hypothetical protein
MDLFEDLTSLEKLAALVASGERESEVLEYKTASERVIASDKREAAKDISAFANSMGGVLIYGVRTDSSDKTRPVALEPIHPENVNLLIHGVPSGIKHPVRGLRWRALPSTEAPQALIIDVPPSADAPHQVLESHRYYRRNGAESAPMTHDLIELYFGRRLQARLQPISTPLHRMDFCHPDFLGRYSTSVALLNTGGQVGRDVFTRIETNSIRATLEEADGAFGGIGAEFTSPPSCQ